MRQIVRSIATWSIKTKLLAGFACVLAILLAVAGIGYYRFLGVANSLQDYVQRVGVVTASRDINQDFSELRRHVREFAITGNPDEATAAETGAEQVEKGIAKGVAITRNPERHRRMEEIAAQFADYRKGMNTAFGLRRDLDKLVAVSLDPIGTAARADFDALIANAARSENVELTRIAQQAQQSLMLLRLNSGKVIDRQRDDAAAKKVTLAQADLTKLMAMLDAATAGSGNRPAFDTLRGHVADYEKAYREGLQLKARLDERVSVAMKPEAEKLANAAAAVKELGTAEQQAIEAATLDAIGATQNLLIALAAGGLVLGFAVAWLIGGGVSRPVLRITEAMHRLASGDLEAEIPALDRADEVGRMAQAMKVFRQNAQEARRLEGEAQRVRAAKDRRQTAMDQCTQDFGASASGVMVMLEGSADTMRKTADNMAQAARQTRDTAAQTAANAATSAQNLGSVAAAAEEMSASIHEISAQVARATRAAQEAVERASVTDAKVGGMATAAERVGDVVRLISDIAGQTNLLALNATIEAARAGEAGKGFAVVAGEVKALAAQTAKATEEIASQIAAIRGATSEAVSAVRRGEHAIGQVSEVAAAIAAAVEEQSATTREIAASVQTVTVATQQASQAMQDVTSVSEAPRHRESRACCRTPTRSAQDGRRAANRGQLFLQAMAKTDEEDRRRYERIDGAGATATLHMRDARR